MTVWRKLENEDCYAVAIYNYAGTAPQHLPLEVGELVHLQGETDEWYWGRSIRGGANGAFPKSYVVIRECTVDKCGETVVASAGGGGVVHDIAVTLREWLHRWKTLYITTNDDQFKFMEVSMRALLDLRAQAASGALPQDQLRKVARTAVFTIDKGNRILGMELAVRTSSGQLVDPLSTSTFRLNAMHDEAQARLEKNMETYPARTTSGPGGAGGAGAAGGSGRGCTVVARVHNFVCRMGEPAELLLALHAADGAKLTDNVLLRWPPPHLAAAPLVFTDLGLDIKKEKIFLVCHVVRIGSMEPQNIDHRRSTISGYVVPTTGGKLRRPFGIACGDVTRHLAADRSDKDIQLPFYPCEKENMDMLLKKVISNRDLKDQKHPQGLWVSLQLVEGDLKQIREETPHLVMGNAAVGRKMGFPEVILPGDARNDLYVTLCSGSFSRGGGKSSERNIELVARLVDRHGKLIPGVVSVGAGVPLVDEYTSLVYYHDDRPRWQEVFKVCLTIEEFKEAHLVFLCRHRSSNEAKDRAERHFALAYLRLMQPHGTTVPDACHQLAVYKLDHKRHGGAGESDWEVAASACLALPSGRDELPAGAERGLSRGPLTLVHKDSLTVATKLCSTKLTQKEEILGVLRWSKHHSEGSLRDALKRLIHVPSEELVKFLQDILDALFNILTQVEEDSPTYSDSSYAALVLDCLLRVISLVADHKYQHFQPVLHVYIQHSFCDALAYEKLIAIMVWAIHGAESGEAGLKRLLLCMKCLESLARLLTRSRQLSVALAPHAADTYCRPLESLLGALVWLMRCGEHALTCQGSALKYLPHAIPHLIRIYPDFKLSEYTVWALEALSLARLSKQRLLALLELVKGPLGAGGAARAALLPHVAATLRAMLRAAAEFDREAAHKSRSVDKAARLLGADTSRLQDHTNHQQIVELCIEVLGEVLTLLSRDDVGPVEADRGELARRLLPTVLHTASTMMRDRGRDEGFNVDPLLRRVVCVLLDMVRQMSEEQYTIIVRALEAESAGGASSLVGDALMFMTALLQRPVFRPHWADMLHLQHYVMLHALSLIGGTIRERLAAADASDSEGVGAAREAARAWCGTLARVAASPPLQLEAASAARRQRALALYGDVRRAAAVDLKRMWYNLGEHKFPLLPSLVGPILEVSFLRDEEVRNTTIPLFFDMMQTEYNATADNGEEGNLRVLESELIDKVDVLAESGRGDEAWRARFVSVCGALCGAAGGALRTSGAALVAAAARQLDALLHYRAAAPQTRLHLVTDVLRFYEQIERPHMYIRYVHRLAAMHRAAQQWTEAGTVLLLHAKLLRWDDEPLPPRLTHPTHPTDPHHLTHRELKKALYLEVADLLNRGRQWELAVGVIKELVGVYEDSLLGYAPLAELHSQLAKLYTAMMNSPRLQPTYFRVIYHGKGFPEYLRNPNGFVYRGNECDKLHDFEERVLDEWPDAEILRHLNPPGEDVTESDGQYLQINAVTPIMGEKLKRFSGKSIDEKILTYYENNNVDKFEFSRPYQKPEESLSGSNEDVSANEFATRWLERTELEISDSLPGILRWFPVVSVRRYSLCPLQVAIESLARTNRLLKARILDTRRPLAPLHPLTMQLIGILDSPVQGGLVNYERAFLNDAYKARHPEHEELLQQLRDLIADQIPLLKYGLEVHGSRSPPREMHAHLLACFRNAPHHLHAPARKQTCDFEPDSPEVQLRITMRDNSEESPNLSHNRMSDISTGNESTPKSKFSLNNAINNWTRNSSSGTLTPRRGKRTRKSEISPQFSASQWYTSAVSNGVSSPVNNAVNNVFAAAINSSAFATLANNNLLDSSPLRELRQELVTERPLRAEAERERRLSQRASLLTSSEPPSNRDSLTTTDSNQDDEEPPPLPQKQSHRSLEPDADNNNTPDPSPHPPPVRYNYDQVISPRHSYLYQSKRRPDILAGPPPEKAPTPPPKKKYQSMA